MINKTLFVVLRLVLGWVLGGLFAAHSTRINLKGIFVAFAILATLFGCQSRENTTVPGHLVGVWKSSAPKYAGRSFEITKDRVIFRSGEETISHHPISDIEIVTGKKINFNIFYLNRDGQEYKFSFYYDPKNNGQIRFKNQIKIVWTKKRR